MFCRLAGFAEKFGRVRIFALTQCHVAETGARGGAKAPRLSQLGHYGQGAAAGFERVLKMLARRVEIVACERDAAHAQLVGHVNDRHAILVKLLLRFQQADGGVGGHANTHPAGLGRAQDPAQAAQTARHFCGRAFRFLHIHHRVRGARLSQAPQPIIRVANFREHQVGIKAVGRRCAARGFSCRGRG